MRDPKDTRTRPLLPPRRPRSRDWQSGAAFLPPLTAAQAEQADLMRERPSRRPVAPLAG